MSYVDFIYGYERNKIPRLWNHFFRAMRAKQLKADYKATPDDLSAFFNWESYEVAYLYSKRGTEDLTKKMLKKDWLEAK